MKLPSETTSATMTQGEGDAVAYVNMAIVHFPFPVMTISANAVSVRFFDASHPYNRFVGCCYALPVDKDRMFNHTTE